jgi:potassium channel subfamily K
MHGKYIGFGDFVPTHKSTRILLFPFAILTITLLANQIAMIIRFLGARARARKDRWRVRYEKRRQHDHDVMFPEGDLDREMQFLEEIYRRLDQWSNMYDLVWSLVGFLVFWVIGAVLFHLMEVCLYFKFTS